MPDKRYDNFSYTLCTDEELVVATDLIGTEVTTHLAEDEYLNTEMGLAQGERSTITTLKGRSASDAFTGKFELSDRKRDMLQRVITRDLKNYIDMAEFEPEAAAAAVIVQELLENNPVNIRAGYSEQSAQTKQLLTNAKLPHYAAAIASTVENHFIKLDAEQTNFDTLVQQHAEAKSGAPTGEVRKHIVDMMYRIDGVLSYLERKAASAGGAYETAASNIEEALNKIMIPARARVTKKENEDTASEES